MDIEDQNKQKQSDQTIIIQQIESKSNGLGIAGFIISLIALFFGWVPIFGWILWVLGLVFSFIGMFKNPKGMAIAGLVISIVSVILMLLVFGAILGAAASLK